MLRKNIVPRQGWQAILESQGFNFHTIEEQPYWEENIYYEITEQEASIMEKATQELHELCLHAVEVVIQRGWLRKVAYFGMVHSQY